MANISDVYEISFEASTIELAEKLEAYLKAVQDLHSYYETTNDLSRDGKIINGGWANGRWTYSSNLEGTFERPEEWFGEDFKKLKATWKPVLALLKKGQTIEVSYSEDEPGCVVHQDGFGKIETYDGKVAVNLDFEEHDKPDCQMMEVDGEWYCEDHDHTQTEPARYCQEASL